MKEMTNRIGGATGKIPDYVLLGAEHAQLPKVNTSGRDVLYHTNQYKGPCIALRGQWHRQ